MTKLITKYLDKWFESVQSSSKKAKVKLLTRLKKTAH